MFVHIACVTGDGFVNMYTGISEDAMYEKVANEFVIPYAKERPNAKEILALADQNEDKEAVAAYFEDHPTESLYIGTDTL